MTVVPAPPTLSNVAQGTLFYRKHGNENVKKSFDIKLTSDKKAVCRQGFTDITFNKIESFYHCIIEKNSQINLIENYGFARDWRTALYKVNSHCIQD